MQSALFADVLTYNSNENKNLQNDRKINVKNLITSISLFRYKNNSKQITVLLHVLSQQLFFQQHESNKLFAAEI